MAIQSRPAPKLFMVTSELPCPYLPGRFERKLVTELTGAGAQDQYELLSRAGFRRSHSIAYRPACTGCSACVPVRIVVAGFQLAGSLARIRRRNADLSLSITVPRATREQYALFGQYLDQRHGDGEMAGMDFRDYRAMVEDTAVDSRMLELRDSSDTLLAACLADWSSDGVSAVYSFFAPEAARRSLGSDMILRLIEVARNDHLPYVYLGYWIQNSRKMAYKSRFRPLEAFGSKGWRLLP
jgi:arginyl-tRNA--protein-N-Asp/Glu arginylyltransferase